MSAKIYRPPTTIKKAELNFGDIKGWKKEEARYIDEVREFCKTNGSSDLRGEQISIPMADSAAHYMVLSLRPLELIHLEIGDEWDSEFAELLTEAKVKEMVESRKRIEKLFPPRN